VEIVKCLIRLRNKIRNKNIGPYRYVLQWRKKKRNYQSTFSSFLRIERLSFYYRKRWKLIAERGKDLIRDSKYHSCVIEEENDYRRSAAEHLALTELTQPIPSRNKTMSIFDALKRKRNKKKKQKKKKKKEENRLRIIAFAMYFVP